MGNTGHREVLGGRRNRVSGSRRRQTTASRLARAGAASLALVMSLLAVTTPPAQAAPEDPGDPEEPDVGVFAAGSVSGTVFHDADGNGSQNDGESGVDGVGVTAYDAAGDEVGSATTGQDGTYSLDYETGDETTEVRLEFDTPDGYLSTRAGDDNGTSVQFVSDGATASYGIAEPDDLVGSDDGLLATAIQRSVLSDTGSRTSTDLPTVITFGVDQTGGTPQNSTNGTTEATVAQTGSVWGIASIEDSYVLSGALFKRGAAVGPGGLGQIYLTEVGGGPDATPWVTIPNAGANPRPAGAADPGSGYNWFHDSVAYPAVGEIGLGAMEISPDYSTLYVVNLNDKQLYSVPVSRDGDGAPVAGEPTAEPIPTAPGCDAEWSRPFGVHVTDDHVFVGSTCTGPTAGDLTGYVMHRGVDEDSFGAPIATVPYSGVERGTAGYAHHNIVGQNRFPRSSANAMPWNDDDYRAVCGPAAGESGDACGHALPQLMISSIDFDPSGDMLIGVKDRFGDQAGYGLGNPQDESSTTRYLTAAAGDLVRACGSLEEGFTLEDNGSCDGVTGFGPGNDQGHGGGEFYDDDYYEPGSLFSGEVQHDQTALGAVLQVPGRDPSIATGYDARDQVYTNGVLRHSHEDGSTPESGNLDLTGHMATSGTVDPWPDNPSGSFAKAGGLGDLDALAALGPVEIGNRVWIDADGDGIQDPGEEPVSGVAATLVCGDVTASTTTDADGEYYFNDDNVDGGLPASTECTVTFDPAGTAAEGMAVTQAGAGENEAIDSDAEADGGNAVVTLVTPAAGADHTFDVGFMESSVCSIGDFVWLDANEDGIQDDGEEPVPDTTVNLLDENGDPVTDENGDPVSTTTDENGMYTFEGLECQPYIVEFVPPEGLDFTEPEQGDDPSVDSNPDPETGRTPPVVLDPDENPDDDTVDAGLVPLEEPPLPGLDKTVNGEDTIDGPVTVSPGDEITYTIAVANPSDTDVENVTVADELPAGVTYVSDDSDGAYDPEAGVWDVGTLPAGGSVTLTITATVNDDVAAGEPITNEAELLVDGEPVPDVPNDDQDDPSKNTDPDDGQDNVDIVPEPDEEPLCTLGDFVWLDTNADGIQDGDEPGVPGVTVNLLDANGDPVVDENGDPVTATTDEMGGYLFEDIACDEYLVEFVPPEGMEFTEQQAGDDPAVDSNPNPEDGITPPVVLDPEENPEDLTVDAGLIGEPPEPTDVPGLDKKVNGDDTMTDPMPVQPGDEIDYTITVEQPAAGSPDAPGVAAAPEDPEDPEDPGDPADPELGVEPFDADDGSITATVVRDVNGNGSHEPELEPGVAGITVVAEDDEGGSVEGTTDADGVVVLDPSPLVGGQYRVRTLIPEEMDYLQAAPAGDDLRPLVDYVDVAGGNDVELTVGVWNPIDYVQDDPDYSIGVHSNLGAIPSPDPVTSRAVQRYSFSDRIAPADPTDLASIGLGEQLASQQEVGTTFGLAYQRDTERLFAASFAKRHTPYGPEGSGAIYVMPNGGDGDAELFTVVPDTGDSSHSFDLLTDFDFFDAPGKEGLGGMALSADGTVLYVVNLNDGQLYSYDATGETADGPLSVDPIPDPGCAAPEDWRPSTVGVRDAVFVGGVCTGESLGDGPEARDGLQVTIYEFDDGDFTEVLSQPLDFQRGLTSLGFVNDSVPGGQARDSHWNSWISEYDGDNIATGVPYDIPLIPGTEFASASRPQPWLGSIAFDVDGSLILGFRDRFGDQSAMGLPMPPTIGIPPVPPTPTIGVSGGDLNKACRNPDGTYSWEGTGDCPDNNSLVAGGPQPDGTAEYFPGDWALGVHLEAAQGAVQFPLQQQEVMSTMMDPNLVPFTGGVGFYNRDTGSTGAGSLPEDNPFGFPAGPAGIDPTNGNTVTGVMFGKANGLGGLALLAEEAPVQIGGRAWLDIDENGIQDPAEPPLPEATVTLQDCGDATGASTTTDPEGLYYFGAPEGLTPGMDCTVQFDYSTSDTSGLPGQPDPTELQPTTPQAGDDPEIDSDPSPDDNTAPTQTGDPGTADHSTDAGVTAEPLQAECTVGDFVWLDVNEDGIQDDGEEPVEGATVTLFLAADDTEVASTTTDAAGLYIFEGVECDEYYITFDPPVGDELVPTQQQAGVDPAGDSNPDDTGTTPNFTLTEEEPEDLTIDAGYVPGEPQPGGAVELVKERVGDGPVEPGDDVTYSLVATNSGEEPLTDVVIDDPMLGDLTCDPEQPAELAPGDVLSCEGTYTVTEDDANNGQIDNTATVTGNDPDGEPVTDEDTETVPVGDEPPDEGIVCVNDVLPEGVTFVSADASVGEYYPETGYWEIGPMADGDTATLTITAGVDEDVEPGEPITNRAELCVDDVPVPDVPNPDQDDPEKNEDPDDGVDNVDIIPEPDESLCTLGDYVWLDLNADGLQDGDEAGVPGVTVNLLDANGEPVLDENNEPVTTTTDELGGYLFEGIACDEYMVEFVPPEGMEFTEQQVGDDPAVDSNPNPNNGITPPVTLDPDDNPEDLTVDAGLVGEEPPMPPGLDKQVNGDDTIEGPVTVVPGEGIDYTITVANSTDADVEAVSVADQLPAGVTYVSDDSDGAYDPDAGVWDVGTLVAGESVTLTITATVNEDVVAGELITNEAELLVDGTPVPDVPNPDQDDPSKNDEPEDGSDNVDIVPEPDELCTLGDYVWLDANADGIQDDDESGVSGVTVNLLDADGEPVLDDEGEPVTVNTNENGGYLFEGIACDEYMVEFVPPEGMEFTEQQVGDDPAADSNPDPNNGITPPVTLDPDDNPEDLTVDAGLVGEEPPTPPGLDKQVNGDDTIEGPVTVVPGEDIDYTITVANPTDADVEAVTVADQLPAGVTYVSDDSGGSYDPEAGVWDVGTLSAGGSVTLTITATVNDDVAPGELITNEAELLVDGEPVPDVPNPDQDDPSKNPDPDDGSDNVDIVPEPDEEPLCTLGDFVWLDTNTDGIQDPDEDGVPGVVVNLLDANGDPVVDENGDPVSVTTDENGMYLFEDIACDEYLVEFVPPEGMEFTEPEQGDDPSVDSNPNPDDGITPPVVLDPDDNPEDLTVDAGLIGEPPTPPGLDKTVNGEDTIDGPVTVSPGEEITYTIEVANPSEVDVENVTVEDQLPPGVTYASDDSGGSYDPESGVWDVGTLPAGESVTLSITATVNEDAASGEPITNEAELSVDGTPVPDVPNPDQDDPSKNDDPDDGQDNVDIVPEPEELCAVGDYVWLDTNEDGIQDADETGVEGVTVVLLTPEGEQVATTTTDADGLYVFDEVACGDYYVWFDGLPEGTGFTEPFAGDPAEDSNVDPGTGTTPVFTVGEGEDNSRPVEPDDELNADFFDPTIDAGLVPGDEPVPPGLDKMVNGDDTIGGPVTVSPGEEISYTIEVVNPSEVDVENVTVEDQLPAGVTYQSDDSGGAYDPDSGVWGIGVLPAGDAVTLTITVTVNDDVTGGEPITNEAQLLVDGSPVPDDPNDDQDDPSKNADPDDGQDNVDIVPEEEPVCSLGDFVWLDANENGIQDDGEEPVPDTTVNLLDENGDPVTDENGDPVSTTTDENGMYTFEGLECQPYIVEFVPPDGLGFTEPEQGDDPAVDSNPDPETGRTPPVVLDPDENPDDGTVDAGLVPPEEPPPGLDKTVNGDDTIEGAVTVAPGEEITYTITVANPSDTDVENVTVEDQLPAGVTYVSDDSDGAYDPDAGLWDVGTLPAGESVTLSITATVNEDAAAGEPITNEAQLLVDGEPVPDVPNPDQDDPSKNPDPDDGSDNVDIVPEPEPVCTLGDYVWLDANTNGVQDPDEDGVPGVTVNLLDANGDPVLDENGDPVTVTTDENGMYLFEGIECDEYIVEFVPPDGLGFTEPEQGDDPAVDSNPDPETGRTPPVVLDPDENPDDDTVDAGLVPPEGPPPGLDKEINGEDTIDGPVTVSPGDEITYTITVTNPSDIDVENVTVEDQLPAGVTYVSDDSDGAYDPGSGVWDVGTLPAGESMTLGIIVTVNEDAPAGEPITNDAQLLMDGEPVPDVPSPDQDDPSKNNDPDDGRDNVDIVPEPEELCAVGDYVWLDDNENGIQDADEAGVEGVTVVLLTPEGETVATSTTDADGFYVFDEVACGDYYLSFDDLPEGTGFTEPFAGNPSEDSNVDPGTGTTPVFTVGEGGDNTRPVDPDDGLNADFVDPTIDAGLTPGEPPEPPGLDKTVNSEDTIEGPVTVSPGEEITYTIEVVNPSEVDVENVTVEDQLPAGVTYVSDDSGGAYDPGTGVWDIGTLAAGESVTLNITVTVNEDVAGDEPITNDAQLLVDGAPVPDDPNPDQDDPSKNSDPDDGRDNVDVVPEPEPTCVLGDHVWLDANTDGIQDPDEDGVSGVVVNLLDANGEPVLDENGEPVTVNTDENGMYLFEGIDCDEYLIEFVPPDGLELTEPGQGDDPVADSNPDPEDGITPPVVLDPDENPDDRTVDAGLVPPTPPGLDKEINGEDTIDGPVTVSPGDEITYTITVVNPSDIDVENVTVADELPAGVTYVSDDSGGSYDSQSGVWDVGTLAGGESVALTITVTIDEDATPGEPITNEVQLSVDGTPVPDDPDPDQDDPSKNDDPDDGSDNVDIVPEPEPEELCTLGDFVWLDADADGVQDPDEDGVPGVTVSLLDADGEPVLDENGDPVSATTDESGMYLFEGIACDEYRLEFVPPAGMELTEPEQGDDPAVDSNPDPEDGLTPPVTLDPEENPEDLTVDAGLVPVEEPEWPSLDKQVGGEDTIDGPMTVSPGEEIIYTITVANPSDVDVENVTVEDRLPDGVTYQSDDSGGAFDPDSGVWDIGTLPAGETVTLTITVTIDDDVPAGESITNEAVLFVDGEPVPEVPNPDQDDPSKNSGPTDGTDSVDVVLSEEGERCAVGDYTWHDANGDGIQGDDEAPISSVQIRLYTPDQDLVATTTSDEQGEYLFDDLECGDYYLVFVTPSGYEPTTRHAGDDRGADSNINNEGATSVFTLSSDASPDLTRDAGYIQVTSSPPSQQPPTQQPPTQQPPSQQPSPTSPPSVGPIPVTGTSIAVTAAVALLALAAGGGLLLAGRRRQRLASDTMPDAPPTD